MKLIEGVVGVMVSVSVASDSLSVVIDGVVSEGASSANTRVGLGALSSQGKIGFGRCSVGGWLGI